MSVSVLCMYVSVCMFVGELVGVCGCWRVSVGVWACSMCLWVLVSVSVLCMYVSMCMFVGELVGVCGCWRVSVGVWACSMCLWVLVSVSVLCMYVSVCMFVGELVGVCGCWRVSVDVFVAGSSIPIPKLNITADCELHVLSKKSCSRFNTKLMNISSRL